MQNDMQSYKALHCLSLLSATASLCCLMPANAQMRDPVRIVADTLPEFSTGTMVRAQTDAGIRTLSIDGGRFSGPADNPFQNLFHSFSQFDLVQNDRALFTQSITPLGLDGPRQVFNIINRVTGGQSSFLNGALDSSQFTNASVYFFNPAGIVIGPGFTANVNGSLYFSTASSLRFSDGSQFIAQTGNGSTLSVASPESFGFIAGRSGDIRLPSSIDQFNPSSIRLNPTGTLHLSAANIDFRRDVPLENALTRIAAVGGKDASVSTATAAPLTELDGNVTFFNASLLLSGGRAGQRGANAALKIGAGTLTLMGTDFARSAASIQSTTGGDIIIDVDNFVMQGISRIGTVNVFETRPNLLEITARHSFTANGSTDATLSVPLGERDRLAQIGTVRSDALITPTSPNLISAGNAQINIIAPTAIVDLNNTVVELVQGSAGGQGSFSLTANQLASQDTRISVVSGSISAVERGNVDLTANQITFFGQRRGDGTSSSSIVTGSTGPRDAGSIFLNSKTGSISIGGTNLRSGSSGTGRAGSIAITSTDDILIRSSLIGSSASGASNGAGSIMLSATDSIVLDVAEDDPSGFSEVATFTTAVGAANLSDAGDITFRAKSINLTGNRFRELVDNSSTGRARVVAQTAGPQTGGSIAINSTSGVFNANFADIFAFTAGGTGNAGNVSLAAQDISVSGSTIGASSSDRGNSGSISFNATRDFILSDRTFVSASGSGSGNVGSISLNFIRNALINERSSIRTDIQGAVSSAGLITIGSENGVLTLSGQGETSRQASAISSSTRDSGRGGSISINVGKVELLNGGQILTSAVEQSPAIGGNISIFSDEVRLDGAGSGIGASSNSGQAGNILVRSDALTLANASFITTNSTGGVAGNINIVLPSDAILFLDGSNRFPQITTTSNSATGGTINISSPFAVIARGSSIEALGPGRQAKVTLTQQFFIRGFDRPNVIAVQGTVFVDGQSNDVTRGTQTETPEFADALRILVSRCSLPKGTGRLNNLGIQAPGPYLPIPPSSISGCNIR